MLENKIFIKGDAIYYNRIGNYLSPQSIVFIHGASITGEQMQYLANLYKEYNCIVLDLPGHYRSKGKAEDSVENYANIIDEFIQDLINRKILTNKVILLGFSMGGNISLELAIKQKKYINGLILCHTSSNWGIGKTLGYKFFLWLLKHNIYFLIYPFIKTVNIRTILNIKVLKLVLKPYFKRLVSKKTIYKDFLAVEKFNKEKLLYKVKVPTLIIQGNKDGLSRLEDNIVLSKKIRNSKLLILNKRSHFGILECKDYVCKNSKEYFADRLD
ncbi:MAG: alpha/beta fold hydrolase [Candidatus Woesearchaeota archaeon]